MDVLGRSESVNDLRADIAAVSEIKAVPTILEVVCRTTGIGFAAVAHVTEDRWVACGVRGEFAGLQPGGELPVETTICHAVRASGEAVIVDNVAVDPRYRDHPTPAQYGFQSCISVPIVLPDGRFFGTLCGADAQPARLRTPEVIGMFKMFAELIAFHLNVLEQAAVSQDRLLDEQKTSLLREQFIAVLGHDLRNPLAAISAGAELLARTPLTEKGSRMVAIIRASANRMSRLIDDVMDFARGRLGSGLTLDRTSAEALEPVLRHVIAELQSSVPERRIEASIALGGPVLCDSVRISQLLSNLLGNALAHGAADQPVRVEAVCDDKAFELAVCNGGEMIPPAVLERMFQPFARGAVRPDQPGLGLGLFIAWEIARAHGGTLTVTSSVQETRFSFKMAVG